MREASQSGYDGGCGIDIRASSLNQGSGGRTDLCDGSTAVDRRSRKSHASERVKSSSLKFRLVPESHRISNSWVIEAILLRAL